MMWRSQPLSSANRIRVYKTIATVLAALCVVGLLFVVRYTAVALQEAKEETLCNQALLVTLITGKRDPQSLKYCKEAVRLPLETGPSE